MEMKIGDKYSRLTVLEFKFNPKRKRYYAKCLCDCGNIKIVDKYKLRTGHTKSCGCLIKEMLVKRNKNVLSDHMLTNHPMFGIWNDQYSRCNNTKNDNYHRYGGRGIKCIWTLKEACNWYDNENTKPEGDYSIDRINNNGNYEASNIRWATIYIQAINREFVKNAKNIRLLPNGKNKYKSFDTIIEAKEYVLKMRKDRLDKYITTN